MIKIKKFLVFVLLLFVFVSCKTVEPVESVEEEKSVDFAYASFECTTGEVVKTLLGGKVLSEYDPLPVEFIDPIVFECEANFYYNKERQTSTYQFIYIGARLLNDVSETIDANVEFATATGNKINLICRTKDLDKYLISCSTAMPKKYNGYYYYLPGMLLNNTMKFLNFVDIKEYDYKWLYNHTIEPDSNDPSWIPGFSYVRWNVYMDAELASYPELLEKTVYYYNVPQESKTEIMYDGIKFELYFQPGFKKYLEDECKLGDKIYFYLSVEGCNYYSKSYIAYVRDFSVISPEEVIEERINVIKDFYNE